MLRTFNKPNVGIGFDERDAPLDHVSVLGWPAARNLCERYRSVALKPRSLNFAGSHLASEHNLERALPECDWRRVYSTDAQVIDYEAVSGQGLPIELLLEANHVGRQVGVAISQCGEVASQGQAQWGLGKVLK
jgi:hypothetical protein